MLRPISNLVRQRAAYLSAMSVAAAAILAYWIVAVNPGRRCFEARVQVIPDHRLSPAFLMKIPPEHRAAVIEYKRSKFQNAYSEEFWTRAGEIGSRAVLEAAVETMGRRGPLPAGFDAAKAAESLEFRRDGRSELLIIRGIHPDPGVSRNLVDGVIAGFEKLQADRRERERGYALSFLKETHEQLDSEIDDAFALPDVGAGPRDVKVTEKILSRRVDDALANYNAAAVGRIAAESAARASRSDDDGDFPECIKEKTALTRAGVVYLDKHPKFAAAKLALEACVKWQEQETARKRAQIEERATVARLREEGFRAKAEALSRAVEQLRMFNSSREPRETELKAIKMNANALFSQYMDLMYDDRAFQPSIRTLDRSETDSRPRWLILLTVATVSLAGAGAAGGLLTARSAIRRRASGAAEISRLGTEVIAEIPPAGHGPRRLKRILGMVDLYSHDRPASDTSERFKHLRTRLMADLPGPASAAICVTSSIPGEGKSFCAINLGIAFAAAGMRTLVVDCDLRMARVTSVFGLGGACGVSDVVFLNAPPEGKCVPTRIRSLSVLPVGTVEGLYSIDPDRIAILLREVKGAFDRIIIDLPPLGVTADPLLVGSVTEGVVLIARKDHVPLHVLEESIRRLSRRPIRFLGTVLNWSGLSSGYFAE